MRRQFTFLAILSAIGFVLLALMLSTYRAQARPLDQDVTPTPESSPAPTQAAPIEVAPGNLSIADEYCLGCHSTPGQTYALRNGSLLDLYVSPDEHADSIHGKLGYACVQCHTTVGAYPHPAFDASDLRDVSQQLYQVCQRCHASQYEKTLDSAHGLARAAGNRDAAICTDCHTAHTVRQLTNPETHELLDEAKLLIPQTCARCHSAIYDKYKESVHGSALTEGNTDVPTCIDCHGVHDMGDPTTAEFRLKSPEICAKCHTDPEIMDKYGISTQVLNTYVADFHGTTVTLFEKQSPDAETNKPVCYDCHGVHDIARSDDPNKGLLAAGNLLARCQACHPGATENFPTAWLSHYIPDAEKTPLVYYVDLFYKFFIPGTLGGMMILVVLDLASIMRRRFIPSSHTEHAEHVEPAAPEAGVTVSATIIAAAELLEINIEESPGEFSSAEPMPDGEVGAGSPTASPADDSSPDGEVENG